MYLAEKTCPTVKDWLAGKNVKCFSTVPVYATYAVYDYEEYLCSSDAETPTCIMTKMTSDLNFNKINDALKNMAQESDCT